MKFESRDMLPVAVIGAGPVGLAAAAQLARRKLAFILLESGQGPGNAVRQWGHVTIFSPWRFNIDGAARILLEETDWQSPEAGHDPTGHELIEQYLAPLAAHPAIAPFVRYDAKVISVTRAGMDRVPSRGRDELPFEIAIAGQKPILARAVIDASGTWTSPNPAGANGLPADGEKELAGRIHYGIPDVAGVERCRFVGKRVLVIGSGHSAMDIILDLVRLKSSAPDTHIVWAMRSLPTETTFGGGKDDQLATRGALGERAKAAIGKGVSLMAPFRVRSFSASGGGVEVKAEDGSREVADEVIVATGFRPDFSMLSEIRLDLHPWLECARDIGELIDPNEHSCGDVPPHGVKELAQPEKDFFIAGMKSYGRAPTFLMATGYEQVRSIVAALAGDFAAAHETHLVLPQTGVCEGTGHSEAGGCCGGPAVERADACCKKDEVAKDEGQSGCGCGGAKREREGVAAE